MNREPIISDECIENCCYRCGTCLLHTGEYVCYPCCQLFFCLAISFFFMGMNREVNRICRRNDNSTDEDIKKYKIAMEKEPEEQEQQNINKSKSLSLADHADEFSDDDNSI